MINQALERASPEQRKVLDANYGQKDQAKETEVKKVYEELKLDDVYAAYEERRVAEIRQAIEKVDESEGLKKGVFEAFLAKIYKRNK